MASRSLMLLRSAIQDAANFGGHTTGDDDLDGLWHSWSAAEKEELKRLESNRALAQAMNDVFVSVDYSAHAVRQHHFLGRLLRDLSDVQLDKMQAMVARKPCQTEVQPPGL